jgi:hypothetical protein
VIFFGHFAVVSGDFSGELIFSPRKEKTISQLKNSSLTRVLVDGGAALGIIHASKWRGGFFGERNPKPLTKILTLVVFVT